uniref:Uncharacterized protein n=1 Tax=Hordeum vulgare subsp. vulgare TaxID=112509 RepID=A0A8I6WNM8_HORVV
MLYVSIITAAAAAAFIFGGRREGTHKLLHALAAVYGKGKIPAEKTEAFAKEERACHAMHGGMPPHHTTERRERECVCMRAEGAKPDEAMQSRSIHHPRGLDKETRSSSLLSSPLSSAQLSSGHPSSPVCMERGL